MAAKKSGDVALVRLKAGGKFYEVGDTVPEQDDMDDLREKGYVGSANDAEALKKKAEEAEGKVADLEAQVAELTAQLEQAQLDSANASADTQESVTDAEAKAAAEAADQKKIGN
jgi:molecular chaperone GrpE (heat shock protein)